MALQVDKNVMVSEGIFKNSPEDNQVLRFDGNVQRPGDLATATINDIGKGATSAEDDVVGDQNWQEPTVAVNPDDDATYAHIDGFFANSTSYYLYITNFGMNLPADAIIHGIIMEIKKAATGAGDAADNVIKMIKNGSIVGDNKANTDDWGTTFSYVSYGGATDLWGTTWTATDINSTSTGVVIQLKKEGTDEQLNISGARMKVYYTIPV